ncbi:Bcr/CflA family efflux MFS transporter [Ruania rhizosphaerae]|uniref:Bcr/CflA family efflux MFS transporter n=1 Tax=Ruania rhizosphaerae TaxID=1840413 RepID=UPI001357900B|nr:Bcr/CflA family efflux MFS transporter [Ruania rhizosphaerae]
MSRPRLYVLSLGLLLTLSTLTIDVYLPAFPEIAADLGADPAQVQFTFTSAMCGMVVGQLLVGSWSDQVGRRLPIVLAIVLHASASVVCAVAPNVGVLTLARFAQGLASAAIGTVALAQVRDLHTGARMLRMLATMALVSGAAIAAGPLLGSLLLQVLSWRGVFVALASYGLLLGTIAYLVVGETLPLERRQRGGLPQRARQFRLFLRDRIFVGLILVTGCAWAAMYTYLASSSFVFQSVYQLSATQYGIVFASHALLMLGGTQLGARLVSRVSIPHVVVISTSGLTLSTASMLVVSLAGSANLIGFLIPLWVFTFFLGLNTPCIQTLALSRHADSAGAAAGLLNATRQSLGAVSTPLPAALGSVAVSTLAVVMVGTQLLGVAILWLVVRPLRLRG